MISSAQNERVLRLTIDIPPLNVLTEAALTELADNVQSLDDSVSAVVLTGEGKCFSAGASVEEHEEQQAPAMLKALGDACLALQNAPVPVVGLVHGPCLGGALELVAFCDFVVADPGAKFGVPEIQLAFFPPIACCQLARLCGRQNAARLVFTGDSIGAEEAQRIGLVQQILPMDEWASLEKKLNRLSLPVVRLAKRAFNMGSGETSADEIKAMNDLFVKELYKTADVQEGIRSFAEKRKPEWKHR